MVVGGLRFYDRREIKDILAYLRAIANPSDSVSLQRIINVPKRGVGKTTLSRLTGAAQELGVPLWEILSDEDSVKTLAGRSARGLLEFSALLKSLQAEADSLKPSELVRRIIDDSGYADELAREGTDEALDRRQNLEELVNAALQFEEENDDPNLSTFLGSASLASDTDNGETPDRVSLMTLHASKGLEFPVVFLVGLEHGLFPSFRSLDDPSALEEERRLCYVGITRAQEQLFLCHACERRLWGGDRQPAIPSEFLNELPEELLQPAGRHVRGSRGTAPSSPASRAPMGRRTAEPVARAIRSATKAAQPNHPWQPGDKVLHRSFGIGQVTYVFGEGEKMSIAVKFTAVGQKILDPRLAPIEPLG
jgi:DNA helicase-2/ATP-dependent DNA helicase PcrA